MADELPDLGTDATPAGRAFRALFEFAPVPIAAVTVDGRVFAANPPLQMLMYLAPRPSLVVDDVVEGETLLLWRRDFTDIAVGDRKTITREVTLVRADGTRVEVRGTIMAVAGTDQELAFILAVIEPLDEQLLVHRRLAVSRAYIHDVANILMTLSYAAERLARQVDPGDPAYEQTRGIRDTAARAVALARATLSETAGGQTQEPQPVDVNGLILGLRDLAAELLGNRVEVVFDPDLERPYVYASATGLERALVNLGANARDAMPDGGTLTIRTRNIGESVVIEVSDTGTGISPDLLDKIFEPEFTTKSTGSGLGLASVRSFATQYGGTITGESAPGHGTTFSLTLPAAPAHSRDVD